jgi:DNA N-6-adenine-methyltransferase (Dam)
MAEHENCIGESDEWFTPKKYFDAIGLKYDLDPAHPGIDAKYCHVPARKVFTVADDGLAMPWHGLVWLNPPYGARYGHVPWLKRLITYNNGIGLFRAYTSADWFHEVLLPAQSVLMFPRGKIKFVRPDGTVGGQPGHGNVFIGLGETACRALLAMRPETGVSWDRRRLERAAPPPTTVSSSA